MQRHNNIIVIKIGTAVLSTAGGGLNTAVMEDLSLQIADAVKAGYKIIIVSSGAIRAGLEAAGLKKRPTELSKLQAAAAIGQIALMQAYQKCLRKNKLHAAQVLLTRDDFADRKRYLNAYNTLNELLYEFGVIPVINENDTIATEEIKFGDNDIICALVANLMSARQLIILTNVDGLLSTEDKKVIPIVTHLTAKIQYMATEKKGEFASGGMKSKLQAARMATAFGVPCTIANGMKKDVVLKIIKGENIGTAFLPQQKRHSAKKRWMAFSPVAKGSIIVDDGAKKALIARGKSLLAAGIKKIEGEFSPSDIVMIKGIDGEEFARGVSMFSSKELMKIKGLKSQQINEIVKRKIVHDEVVHRDNMVIL